MDPQDNTHLHVRGYFVKRQGKSLVHVLNRDVLDGEDVPSELPLLEGGVTARWSHHRHQTTGLLCAKKSLLKHGQRPEHVVLIVAERIARDRRTPGNLASVDSDQGAWRDLHPLEGIIALVA